MDRRKYLKSMALGAVTTGVILEGCAPAEKKEVKAEASSLGYDRTPEEAEYHKKLMGETFFDAHETKTIAILADIIIPKDDVSGSATDAGVPEFIEFIAKDMPRFQTPLRGGLKWLDIQCMKSYEKAFSDCSQQQQIEMIDKIAYPEQATPDMAQGVAFFNTMRDLTACGFFSSKIGIADIGYAGNQPNKWDGVPQEVLDQYGVKYTERELNESVKHDQA
ncbi:MAG TPA: gluconate 2-dehydrogenase subunit 3 family protein [Cyclobacteriaceae bacterium]|nr:gluconate 2-dehydrogenase subunit 3 family protein [Cyclobacteriaceae bacterium]